MTESVWTFIMSIKGEDYSTRDEHGRFTGSVPHGGGSSGGGSGSDSGAKATEQLSDSTIEFHAVTDEVIDSIPKITAFDDAALNQAVHTGCVDVLKAIKNDLPGTEATVSISLNLEQKTEIRKGEPGAGTVKGIPLSTPYVSIHNHASGETFSNRDIKKFIKDDNNIHSVVVGNNGSVFVLSKNADYDMIGSLRYIISSTGLSETEKCKGMKRYGITYSEKRIDTR